MYKYVVSNMINKSIRLTGKCFSSSKSREYEGITFVKGLRGDIGNILKDNGID